MEYQIKERREAEGRPISNYTAVHDDLRREEKNETIPLRAGTEGPGETMKPWVWSGKGVGGAQLDCVRRLIREKWLYQSKARKKAANGGTSNNPGPASFWEHIKDPEDDLADGKDTLLKNADKQAENSRVLGEQSGDDRKLEKKSKKHVKLADVLLEYGMSKVIMRLVSIRHFFATLREVL